MTTETVHLATMLSGDMSNPQNALGPPDNIWAGPALMASDWTQTWGFTNPAAPVLATGTQQIQVIVRRALGGGTLILGATIRRGTTVLASTSTSSAAAPVALSFSDPGGSSQGLTLELSSSISGGLGGVQAQVDAATWTAIVEDETPASPWSVWEGGVEVPVAMAVFEGGVEIPVT